MSAVQTELFNDLKWIESLGYDTVIQFCHPHELNGIVGGHVFTIFKPGEGIWSGHWEVWIKSDDKLDAITKGIALFKKQRGGLKPEPGTQLKFA